MPTDNRFRDYRPDQLLLLPQDMREWLPEDHLANFISDIVDELDLSAIEESYDGSAGGQPAYHPRMMVKLLFYAYAIGVPSSRKVERNTYDSVPFRVLACGAHPDHDTIAEFRRRHLAALAGLFLAVLRLCRKAGLVKLGHVALDGTKVRANASKHKAMSYGRMEEKERELAAEVARLLAEAEAADTAEDARYGRGRRGDELPEELRFKRSRLEKIRAAKRSLEEDARREVEAKRPRKGGPGSGTGKPSASAQRNFTDADSRIMKDSGTKAYVQGYNCQVAVDSECQVVVAAAVTQECNDKEQLVPMVERIQANTNRRKPRQVSADSGYYSEENIRQIERRGIDPYVATGKQKHGEIESAPRGRIPKGLSLKDRMTRKLRTVKGRRIYGKRKEVAEPVIGQIKEARGFRRFLLRGVGKVTAEWLIICLTHNLLKLFRWSWRPALAGQP
jgi:transposase